jgi:hypothetical protein
MSDGVTAAVGGSQHAMRPAAGGGEAATVPAGDAEVRCALDLGSGGEHLGGNTNTHTNTHARTHTHTHTHSDEDADGAVLWGQSDGHTRV